MNRIDILTNVSTLGTSNNSPILQILSIAFDIRTNNIISTFTGTSDITHMQNIEGNGILTWLHKDRKLFYSILKSNHAPEDEVLKSFVGWWDVITNIYSSSDANDGKKFLWGNNILFSEEFLRSKCSQYNLKYSGEHYTKCDISNLAILSTTQSTKSDITLMTNNDLSENDTLLSSEFALQCNSSLYNAANGEQSFPVVNDCFTGWSLNMLKLKVEEMSNQWVYNATRKSHLEPIIVTNDIDDNAPVFIVHPSVTHH